MLGIAAYKENFGPFVDEVVTVPADDIEAVATLMSQRGNEVAAIITEPVQGAGGVYPPPDGYLQSLRKLCDQHGAYLIFDEVITGFGRTGSWFAAHHYGVSPDFATFAKGVTSGYIPLGGVFVGIAPTAALETDPDFVLMHGFTYSGHPTACAAGLKNLEIMRREVSSSAPSTSKTGWAAASRHSPLMASSITFAASAACGPSACDPTRMPRQCAITCSTRAA